MATMNIVLSKEVARLRHDLERVLHLSGESPNIDFLISSLTEYSPFNTTEEIEQWLRGKNSIEYFHVEPIPLADMRKWYFDQRTGDLRHESGGFFSIRGLKVRTSIGPVKEWTQPIIDQREVGVLGIITKKVNGVLYLLVQAKPEPGNINIFQLSPTVQATRSNYLRVHQGKPTRYLEYFLNSGRAQVLIDQLQSEQGARFYQKRNRNIIVRIKNYQDIELGPNFRWVTLGQLKRLMRMNSIVNMDARSVVSNISFDPEVKSSLEAVREDELRDCLERSKLVTKPLSDIGVKMLLSAHGNTPSIHSSDDLLRRLSQEKFNCELETRIIPLNEVRDWKRTPLEISHVDGTFFSVIGVRVSAESREVPSWDQPIIRKVDAGIVGFITRDIGGTIHFLVQLKMESGNMDLLELAPTVQCITGSYQRGKLPPFVSEMLNPTRSQVVFDTMQSEEGGRFYHEENRNILLLGNERFPIKELPRYFWANLNQLKLFLKFNNFLNVESRSLLANI